TWEQLNDHTEIRQLIFQDSAILECTESDGRYSGDHRIYCSTDNGSSWESPNIKFTKQYLWIRKCSKNLFITSETSGLFISSDKGVSWKQCTGKGFPGMNFNKCVAFDTLLFAVSEEKLFVSSDYGENWKLVKQVKGTVSAIFLEGDAITADTDEDIYFHSLDGGKTWESEEHEHPVPLL
ncbi:MAG: WD40/YVTN/BNR-like repeat-containing protein, partial [Candidatus Kapaibacterium sp.]